MAAEKLIWSMTAEDFRRMALSFPEATESAHVGHPDFRINGRIFATLGYPDESFGVLMLTENGQAESTRRHPEVFKPVAGAWGRRGNTQVRLANADAALLRPWMETAWKGIMERKGKKARRNAADAHRSVRHDPGQR